MSNTVAHWSWLLIGFAAVASCTSTPDPPTPNYPATEAYEEFRNQVDAFYDCFFDVRDDMDLLRDVASSCGSGDCLAAVASQFDELADTFGDRCNPPPCAKPLVDFMDNQLRVSAELQRVKAEGDYYTADLIGEYLLEQLQTQIGHAESFGFPCR